jgi:sulfoxide reductase heme-binding subunit YedZ
MLATSSTAFWYTTRATGIVALILLTATMVLGILTAGRAKSRAWPAFAQAELHKRISIMAMVFVTIHVLTSVLDTYVHLGWLSIVVPFSSPYQPLWTGLGTVAVDLMIAVAVSSALRQRISPHTWRGIHWLAYGSWPVAMAHSLGEGTDASKLWMDAIAAVSVLAVAGALAWRIADHTRAKDEALRVGATTRAVPPRGAPPVGRQVPTPSGRPPARNASSPRVVTTSTRLLEKDRP